MSTYTFLPTLSPASTLIDGEVALHVNLPAPGTKPSEIWLVQQPSGIYLINRKEAGLYYSDGASWSRLGNIPSFFNDANFKIFNNVDNSKKTAWDSSAIATGNTRTVKMADANVDLADVAGVNEKIYVSIALNH